MLNSEKMKLCIIRYATLFIFNPRTLKSYYNFAVNERPMRQSFHSNPSLEFLCIDEQYDLLFKVC